jgi:CRP/FNR family cyclic AMP-dependent transcriptional regulator
MQMETIEGLIAEHPFFNGLEMRHFKLLVGCASNVRFEAGQFVFREGEEAN